MIKKVVRLPCISRVGRPLIGGEGDTDADGTFIMLQDISPFSSNENCTLIKQ